MGRVSAWHEGHELGGHQNPACPECQREMREHGKAAVRLPEGEPAPTALPESTGLLEAAARVLAESRPKKAHGQLCPVWTQRLKKVRHAATIADCDCWILPDARRDAEIVIDTVLATMRDALFTIPLGFMPKPGLSSIAGWNRYDTDDEHVLHLFASSQEHIHDSWDIRVPK